MRHRKSGRKLNRTWEHRKAMFRNMARSLLVHERIRTTEPKAKELRKVVDRLITLTKSDTLHARRQAYRVLGNHSLVKQLFEEIGPRFANVPGGYTRVAKLGLPRKGDAAPMAIIELTRRPGATQPEEEPKKEQPASETAPTAEPVEKRETAETAEAPETEAEQEQIPSEEQGAEDETAQQGEAPKEDDGEKAK